jgi:hypothetical protein
MNTQGLSKCHSVLKFTKFLKNCVYIAEKYGILENSPSQETFLT